MRMVFFTEAGKRSRSGDVAPIRMILKIKNKKWKKILMKTKI